MATPAPYGMALPVDPDAWRFMGQATTTQARLRFTDADAGKTATVMARWINAKGQPGPLSYKVTATVAA